MGVLCYFSQDQVCFAMYNVYSDTYLHVHVVYVQKQLLIQQFLIQ